MDRIWVEKGKGKDGRGGGREEDSEETLEVESEI